MRVFVHLPKIGYVGVGTVTEAMALAKDFKVVVDGKETPIADAPLKNPAIIRNVGDPERCEHFVRVKWTKAVPRENAFWIKGLFANQSTVCTLSDHQSTLEQLAKHFGVSE